MSWVKSSQNDGDFTKGRKVMESFTRHDDSPGYVVGVVDMVGPNDTEISQRDYDIEVQAIKDYNATLPLVVANIGPRRTRLNRITAIADLGEGNWTSAELREIVHLIAREVSR